MALDDGGVDVLSGEDNRRLAPLRRFEERLDELRLPGVGIGTTRKPQRREWRTGEARWSRAMTETPRAARLRIVP